MKKGYTLAETLVTLAIIGLIAGILFPVVNRKIPNKEMLGFKKAYSSVVRVTNEMINDETLYNEEDGFADTRTVPYDGHTYGGDSKFCGLLAAKLGVVCDDEGRFTTIDGMDWTVSAANFAGGESSRITVDINGSDYGENRLENENPDKPDIFVINVSRDGSITVGESDVAIEMTYRDEDDSTKTYKELKRTPEAVGRPVRDDFFDD